MISHVYQTEHRYVPRRGTLRPSLSRKLIIGGVRALQSLTAPGLR